MNKKTNDYSKYVEYINSQDTFFVKDVLQHFGIKRTEPQNHEERMISTIILSATYIECIQRCGKVGNNTQYILVSKIPLDFKVKSVPYNTKKNYR